MEASRARTITTIIGGALEELRERRARIQPFVDELKSIERAIAQLEKAAGGGSPSRRSSGASKGAREVPDELREKILTAVGNAGEPLDTAAIAEEAGVGKGPYLYSMLRQLVERGDLVQDDVGYTIPRGD